MSPRDLRARIDAVAGEAGFNLTGVIAAEAFDAEAARAGTSAAALLGGARAVVVVASAGGALWPRFRAWRAGEGAAAAPDPLDRYTRAVGAELVAEARAAGFDARAVHPFEDAPRLPFVALGRAAGLGVPSLLGLLLHPVHGTWLALRAALLTTAPLEPDAGARALAAFDPCGPCPRPCAAACPAGAVGDAGWDIPRCASWRSFEAGCETSCAARGACPYGADDRYPAEQIAYHHGAAAAAMRAIATRARAR